MFADSLATRSVYEGGLATGLGKNDGSIHNGTDAAGLTNSKTCLPDSLSTERPVRTPKSPKDSLEDILTSPKLRKSMISPLILDIDQAHSIADFNTTTTTTTAIERNSTLELDMCIDKPLVTVQEVSKERVDSVITGKYETTTSHAELKQNSPIGIKRAASNSFTAQRGSQSKDVLMSELKAMKIVSCVCIVTADATFD